MTAASSTPAGKLRGWWWLATTTAWAVSLTLVVAAGWRPLLRVDHAVVDNVTAAVARHRWLFDAAMAVTRLGDPVVVDAATVAAVALLLSRRRPVAAAYVVGVRCAAVVVSTAVKSLLARPRPELSPVLAHAHGYAFPSGHALGTAALLASVALATTAAGDGLARAACIIVPVAVAVSRVLIGVHYPSDVAAGLGYGWAIALGLHQIFRLCSPAVHRQFTRGS